MLTRGFNTAFVFFCAEHGSPCLSMLRHLSCLRAPGHSSICVWGGRPAHAMRYFFSRASSSCCADEYIFLRQMFIFLRDDRRAHSRDLRTKKKKYENEVLQDRRSPVLGAIPSSSCFCAGRVGTASSSSITQRCRFDSGRTLIESRSMKAKAGDHYQI